MSLFKIVQYIYRRRASLTGLFGRIWSRRALLALVIFIVAQFAFAVGAEAAYGSQINTMARVIDAPINFAAGLFSSFQNILYSVSGGKLGESAQVIDGRAIRDKKFALHSFWK